MAKSIMESLSRSIERRKAEKDALRELCDQLNDELRVLNKSKPFTLYCHFERLDSFVWLMLKAEPEDVCIYRAYINRDSRRSPDEDRQVSLDDARQFIRDFSIPGIST